MAQFLIGSFIFLTALVNFWWLIIYRNWLINFYILIIFEKERDNGYLIILFAFVTNLKQFFPVIMYFVS